MAIINGPYASKMRGKVGEVVAAKTTGNRTALRSYQPEVKNPNTLRQRVSRMKLSVASNLAALLADAINIGFAKAAAGTKMYPRNMFVKRIIPTEAAVLGFSNGEITVDVTKLVMSEAIGIQTVPIMTNTQPDTGFAEKIILNNPGDFTIGDDEELGLVVVAFDNTNKIAIVGMNKASEGVQFTDEQLSRVTDVKFYGFVKLIPKSLNGVPTEQWPWKYPSATSATILIM